MSDAAVQKEVGDERMSPGLDGTRRRGLWRRALDFVFGYDFFISYSWEDGKVYASALARRLEAAGFEAFLDRKHFATGDDWKAVPLGPFGGLGSSSSLPLQRLYGHRRWRARSRSFTRPAGESCRLISAEVLKRYQPSID